MYDKKKKKDKMSGTIDIKKKMDMVGIRKAAKSAKGMEGTKKTPSTMPKSAETWKLDPAYQGKVDYKKSKEKNLEEKLRKMKSKPLREALKKYK